MSPLSQRVDTASEGGDAVSPRQHTSSIYRLISNEANISLNYQRNSRQTRRESGLKQCFLGDHNESTASLRTQPWPWFTEGFVPQSGLDVVVSELVDSQDFIGKMGHEERTSSVDALELEQLVDIWSRIKRVCLVLPSCLKQ